MRAEQVLVGVVSAVCLLPIAAVAPAVAGSIAVTDDSGNEIVLDRPARRIISLAPNVTETLFSAGAGEHVIGAVSYSDYPEAANDIPRVGSIKQLNMEAILAKEPDLVVSWRSGNPGQQIERLRELGVTVYVSEIRRLEDIPDSLRNIGKLSGTEDVAEQAADDFMEKLTALRETYAHRASVSVFYQIWDDPLMTINGDHLISDVIEDCGGRNVFADMSSLAPRIDVESVLARNPEFILASGMGEERPDWLDQWREWPELSAVQAGNLYFIPPAILQRQTARILVGMEKLCGQVDEARNAR